MKLSTAVIIVMVVLILLIFQFQIIDIQLDNREQECRMVETPYGIRLANDYEYYSCIGR